MVDESEVLSALGTYVEVYKEYWSGEIETIVKLIKRVTRRSKFREMENRIYDDGIIIGI